MATIEMRERVKNGKVFKRFKATVTLKDCPRTSKTFDRKGDAEDWAKKTEYELKHQRVFGHAHHKSKTLTDAIDRYLASLKAENPGRYRGVAPLLAWWSARIGSLKIGNLSKDVVHHQRDKLKALHIKGNATLPNLSNARVNRYVAALIRVLNVATDDWGWITKNPLDGLEMLPEPTGRTRFLQADDLAKLLAAARSSENRDLEAIVALAVTTGARHGEIARIRYCDVDFVQRKILLPKTKNGDPRIIHLVEPAHSLVVEVCGRKNSAKDSFIFASPCDESRPNSFRRAWKTATRRAGLIDFRFHDLRHTAASNFAKHGAGLHQIGALLGHRSLGATRRYTHLVEKDLAAIVENTAIKVFDHDKQQQLEKCGKLQLPATA